MHSDQILHPKEKSSIHEIGIKMGLNPSGFKRILDLMEKSPNKIIKPEVIICAFEEQLN